jgi:hypothetical protein
MYTTIHPHRQTFKKYDNNRYIVYLNEQITENYDETGDAVFTAFSYTGIVPDGGTLIEVDTNDQLQNALINGIIRSKYTLSEEDAIKTHQILLLSNPEHEKTDEYRAEFAQFSEFRENCIKTVREWLK